MGSDLARALGTALVMAGIALGAVTSWAQAAASPTVTDADKASARKLMDDADQLFAQGRHAEALEAYRAAEKLVAVPTTTVEVAKALEALGRLVEARETYLRVLAYAAAANEPPIAGEARKRAQERGDALQQRLPMLAVSVTGVPPTAEVAVLVDGRPLRRGTHDVPRVIDPGEHEIVARAEGFQTGRLRLALKDGEQRRLAIALEPQPATPAGPEPVEPPPSGAAAAPVARADEASGGGVPALAWLGWGLGGAAIVAGAVTGGMAFAREADLDGKCGDDKQNCGDHKDELESAKTIADVSTVLFIVGPVLAAGGTVAFFVMRDDGTQGARVRPYLGLGGAGVLGRF